MSASIIIRDFEAADQKRIVLSNSEMARIFDIGTNWNQLRIGVHYILTDPGHDLYTPRNYYGVIASPNGSNGVLTSSTSHFLGCRNNPSIAMVRIGIVGDTPGQSYFRANNTSSHQVVKRIGSTDTAVAVATGNQSLVGTPTTRRSVLLVEITKGSPNFTVQAAALRGDQALTTTGVLDTTTANLTAAMEAADMTGAVTALNLGISYLLRTASTIAVNEAADGYFNAVCIGWGHTTHLMEVSNLLVSKVS